MRDHVFGEMVFNTGWKTEIEIFLFGKLWKITVKAKAYFEKDGITTLQESAFLDFSNNKEQRLKRAEKLALNYSPIDAKCLLVPKTLIFNRDGSYALLFDDKNDDENGIAVCLFPSEKVVTQDDYL